MPQSTHSFRSRRKNDTGEATKQQPGQHMSSTHLQRDARIAAKTTAKAWTLATRSMCDDQIESILDAFVPQQRLPCVFQEPKEVPRICGAWVTVLHKLSQNCRPVYNRVFSLCIAALSSGVRVEPYRATIGTYSAATDALRTDLTLPNDISDPGVVAAIMCLTLAEVFYKVQDPETVILTTRLQLFLPDSHFGLTMHVNGVAQFFQRNGPERFGSGVLHELFAGFRPLFVSLTQSRRCVYSPF